MVARCEDGAYAVVEFCVAARVALRLIQGCQERIAWMNLNGLTPRFIA